MAYLKKCSYLAALLIFICILNQAKAASPTIKNAGFIQSSIWFSKEPFFDGESVRIYSLIFDSRKEDFKGKVVFYDNGKVLAETPFSVLGNGGSETVWTDWIPASGQHKISAAIKDASLSLPGKPAEPVAVENGETSSLDRTVENAPAPPHASPEATQGTAPPKNNPAQTSAENAIVQNPAAENYLVKTVTKEMPTIANAVKLVTNKLDSIASDIKIKIDKKKDEVKTEIQKEESAQNLPHSSATATEAPSPLQKPLNYLLLAGLYFSSAILSYKFLLYPILLWLAYKIFKMIVKSAIRNS